MVPRAVQDAGYTAVGLGVLALQQVQTRRRQLAEKVGTELDAAGRQAQALVSGVKTTAEPVIRTIEGLPPLPTPLGALIDAGRARLCQTLRP